MIKSEIVNKISNRYDDESSVQIHLVINTILNEITDTLCAGNRVEIRGFGSFSVRERRERIGRNPSSGEIVPVSAKSVPFFRSGRLLRSRVDGKSYL